MCGIAGFVTQEDTQSHLNNSRVLRNMTQTLYHRGPDSEGYYLGPRVALGHRRLAIIDLAHGGQPMTSRDGSAVIVFNGEIYNYLEVRRDLQGRGHVFTTESDTEVILTAYQEWGIHCVERFNGMWAFALWDDRRQLLFCSRDRTGEKPFYYSVLGNTFVFGSEPKALFSYGVDRVPNLETLDAYLCFTYVPGRDTFFKHIYKLRPGYSLVVTTSGIREHPYWVLRIPSDGEARRDEDRVLEEFTTLFESAVQIRMRSHVPFGAFLSGGLDSGSVVAVMSAASETPIRTCTIGFRSTDYDERKLSRLVATRFKTVHTERVVEPSDIDELMMQLAWHYDEPFGDSSALPTYLLSKVVREQVTMVLTGDGGDEVTAGYPVHLGERLAHLYAHLPSLLAGVLLPAGVAAVCRVAPSSLRPHARRALRVVNSCNMDFIDRLESKQNGFSRADRRRLILCKGVRPAREYIEDALKPVANRDNSAKLNYWLTTVALPDDMLCKVDRASMAHSLEARAPFLDHRIVELLSGVSMSVKLRSFQRKAVLRRTIARRLPPELLKAPKRGFSIPISEWLRSGAAGGVEQRAMGTTKAGVLCHDTVAAIISSHKSGARDAAQAIWTLGMLSQHV